MPSDEFDPLVALARIDPSVVAHLLSNLFGVEVPNYHHARPLVTASNYELQSEWGRGAAARGAARALLIVLDERGVAVPDEVRNRVSECTDYGEIDIWLGRAITATTIDDVIRG